VLLKTSEDIACISFDMCTFLTSSKRSCIAIVEEGMYGLDSVAVFAALPSFFCAPNGYTKQIFEYKKRGC